MVHVVACVHLGGAAVTAPVMRNDSIAVGKEEQHLYVPVVRRQRPAVVKHKGLSVLRAPVLVENLRTVPRLQRAHANSSSQAAVSVTALLSYTETATSDFVWR